MNEMPKMAYEPSQEKRFEISGDEYSRERIEMIRLFYDKLRSFFGVSMGLVLFGSLAKGKKLDVETKENADIDFTLFIDLDVGGGIKPYRQAFIKELLSMNGNAGEELWRIVDDSVRYCERNGIIPEGIEKQFPDTLQKAARYYGVLG